MSYIDDLFDTLMQLQQNKRLPPLNLWQPERSGEIDIRIDREGRWYHEGTRIERQPLVDLFATILRLEANGYYLVTPVEKMKILVEEVPFIAVDLDVRGSGEDKQLLQHQCGGLHHCRQGTPHTHAGRTTFHIGEGWS